MNELDKQENLWVNVLRISSDLINWLPLVHSGGNTSVTFDSLSPSYHFLFGCPDFEPAAFFCLEVITIDLNSSSLFDLVNLVNN